MTSDHETNELISSVQVTVDKTRVAISDIRQMLLGLMYELHEAEDQLRQIKPPRETPRCERCQGERDQHGDNPVTFAPCPYADARGPYAPPLWLCKFCREESAHDI